MAEWAAEASLKGFVLRWPSDPIRPQRVDSSWPATETSQNLFDAPCVYSNRLNLLEPAWIDSGRAGFAGAGAAIGLAPVASVRKPTYEGKRGTPLSESS